MRFLLGIAALVLFLFEVSYSQTVSGYLTDENGGPLSGGNIYIQGTNAGIATNKDGYFSLKLRPGNHKILISYVGYVGDTLSITMKTGENVRKDVRLRQATIQFSTMDVFPAKYNSAEEVVLSAIEKKERYLSKIDNYEYSAYSRTSFIPSSEGAKEVIGGITEIQSKGYFEAPRSFQEIVLAKRQTANFSELYNVFSSGKILSILDDVVSIDELSVVSPLNSKALESYHFEMIDTSYYDQRRVFNISVKPALRSIPLFEGRISIIDEIFSVIDVELFGKERIKSTLKSDIALRQSFREFENRFWLPVQFSMTFYLDLGLPGVRKLKIKQQSHLTDYVINSPDFRHQFDNRVIRKADIGNAAADSIWDKSQLIGLTNEERDAYRSIDSSMATKGFLTRFLIKLPELYLKIKKLPITELGDFYRYNRTEGNYLGLGFTTDGFSDGTRVQMVGGYGFADKKTKYALSLDQSLISETVLLQGSLFNSLKFLDPYHEYKRVDVTFRQLLLNKDYADYYYSRGWSAGVVWKVFQNFQTSLGFSQEEMSNAGNNANASLFNLSLSPRGAVPVLEGTFQQVEFSLGYDNRTFYDYSWGKVLNMAEDFFRVKFEYTAAPKFLHRNEQTFRQYHLFLNVYSKVSPYANVNVSTLLGFLDNDAFVQRGFHLPGSYGSFSNLHQFRSLREDTYLGRSYAAFFIENNFKNTVFNLLSLPFLKNSKYDLYLCGNFGWIDSRNWPGGLNVGQNRFSEAGFGLGNIFFFMRIDFTWRIAPRDSRNFFFSVSSTVNY